MSRSNKITLGITIGDPAGIGPEVTRKAVVTLAHKLNARFFLIGDKIILKKYFAVLPKNCTIADTGNRYSGSVICGKPGPESSLAAISYINSSINLIKNKKIHVLVTAPVSKEGICSIGVDFPGHTEYLAKAFGAKRFGMMFVAPKLRTMIATRHLPIRSVPRAISARNVLETIELTHLALKKYFKLKNPKISVCGLNPHAGEGGTIGTEEHSIIIPAMQIAQRKGIHLTGPFAADTLFSPELAHRYDAVIAMYHDQGLIPVKTLYFSKVVNLTVGLPFIRTSPAHGTAYDIAGQNKANPSSMIEAVKLAVHLASTP